MTTFAPEPALPAGTMPAADSTETPVRRCLSVLNRIIDAGVNIARRLTDSVRDNAALRASSRLFNAVELHWKRVASATAYASILALKLRDNPAYRGEPARTPKNPAADRPDRKSRTDPPDWDERGRFRLPTNLRASYERIFAGQDIVQIVDHIRNDIGLAIELGPWFDTILNQPDVPPPITITETSEQGVEGKARGSAPGPRQGHALGTPHFRVGKRDGPRRNKDVPPKPISFPYPT